MKKRGQVQQVFVYIFAIVLAAMIIFFGYYIITKVMDLFNQVDTVKFQQDFKKQIGTYYTYAPNTNGNVQVRTPAGIKAICFISGEASISNIQYSDVKSSATASRNNNIFFSTTKADVKTKPFYVDKLKTNPDPLCINTLSGVLDIDLITTGNYVELSAHTK